MQKVEIIIPQTNNSGESLGAVIAGVKTNLCNLFGGYTAFEAQGGWVSDSGELFEEPVVVLISAATKASDAQLITTIARDVLEITDQLAMFISIDGQAQIID